MARPGAARAGALEGDFCGLTFNEGNFFCIRGGIACWVVTAVATKKGGATKTWAIITTLGVKGMEIPAGRGRC